MARRTKKQEFESSLGSWIQKSQAIFVETNEGEKKLFLIPMMDKEKTTEFVAKLLESKGLSQHKLIRRIVELEVVKTEVNVEYKLGEGLSHG